MPFRLLVRPDVCGRDCPVAKERCESLVLHGMFNMCTDVNACRTSIMRQSALKAGSDRNIRALRHQEIDPLSARHETAWPGAQQLTDMHPRFCSIFMAFSFLLGGGGGGGSVFMFKRNAVLFLVCLLCVWLDFLHYYLA